MLTSRNADRISLGKLSYNIGSSWDYTGAWSPGQQMQQTSLYGGGRYQLGTLSLDLSVGQGWTSNKVRGIISQVLEAYAEDGTWLPTSTKGITPPLQRSLVGRTLSATLGYNPVPWWSQALNVGSDASNIESIGSDARYGTPSDTAYPNTQSWNTRTSQTYASSLRIPVASVAQATLTFGGDHWQTRSSTVNWSIQPLAPRGAHGPQYHSR